jgi:hypothetical protein
MAIKLGGWQRIGVILSVLWFIGFGVFMFDEEISRHSASHVRQLGNCNKIAEFERQWFLRRDDPAYATKDAEVQRKLDKCRDDADAFFMEQDPRSSLWIILLIDLASIALAWLLVWTVVSLVRWVSRGFQNPQRSNARLPPIKPTSRRTPNAGVRSAAFGPAPALQLCRGSARR